MPRESSLRHRGGKREAPHSSAILENDSGTAQHSGKQPVSWRFYVRWLARIAIPIVLVLSNARVVTIPGLKPPSITESTALLIITHSRHEYLSRCLESILSYHPGEGWPIIVSMDRQDGEPHDDVAAVVDQAADRAASAGVQLFPWAHEMSYDQDVQNGEGFVDNIAYRRISRHYEWALRGMFSDGIPGQTPIHRVVIVEDDMEIASDFFSYFATLAPLLHADKSLFCISAWNDNGIPALAKNSTQLHRTDFFPGLGWMLTRELWQELEPKWPKMFWDDWMRSEEQIKGRHCIRPEVSRTINFGEKGVSQSFHFKKHIANVALGKEAVDFSTLNLSYLQPDAYHDMVFSRMSDAVQLKFSNYLTSRPQQSDVIAFYPEEQLEAIGRRTGIMIDHRNGIRRTSYKGVIIIPWNGYWAFIVKRGWSPPSGYRLGSSVCC